MTQASKPHSDGSSSSRKSRRTYKAPALEKGLEILECLAAAASPLTLQHLSLALGRSSSEIYRMLEVLVDQGYVLREAGVHRLSMKLFNLGVGQVPARNLLTVSLPVMEEVTQLTRQALHLSVHVDRRLVVVASIPSPEPLGFSVRLGSHFPFRTDRTSARVITAFQPAGLRDRLLDEMIELARPTRVSRQTLSGRLDRLRERGHEEVPSDTVQGIVDIAFPIFDGQHAGAIASLNMPYLTQRDARMSRAPARQVLAKAVQRISQELGGVAPK
jgi:DNA-binding IclR family transcriptional regulator